MVCSLHSVTTGSRDRANVSLIIIIMEVSRLKRNGTAELVSRDQILRRDRAGLRGYVQFNKYTYIHTYICKYH